jgi:hypothetical protein
MKSENILPQRTLLQRLAWVQSKVDYIQKEKKQGMRYSIVSHDAVTAKVRPLMVEAGVIYYPRHMLIEQSGNRTQLQMDVRFVSIDDPLDFIDVATAGYGIDDQDKGPGKAISYAVKYALLKCLGLESGDDPDYDQDVKHRQDSALTPNGEAATQANLLEFEDAVMRSESLDGLTQVSALYAETLTLAKSALPTAYLKARQAYSRRLAELKAREQT